MVRNREFVGTPRDDRGGLNRMLADQVRGCDQDPRYECGHAEIQQDFIKDVGHDTGPHNTNFGQRMTAKC